MSLYSFFIIVSLFLLLFTIGNAAYQIITFSGRAVKDSAAKIEIVLGDARLNLERESSQQSRTRSCPFRRCRDIVFG